MIDEVLVMHNLNVELDLQIQFFFFHSFLIIMRHLHSK